MNRREALALIPAASLSAQPFLGKESYATLEDLCDLLLPSEPGSPGAREARVAWYIDTVIRHSPAELQALWRDGLASINLKNLDREAADESSFFNTRFKSLAIEAFCLSKEGQQALGYKGNRAIDQFPGCTHPEHIR